VQLRDHAQELFALAFGQPLKQTPVGNDGVQQVDSATRLREQVGIVRDGHRCTHHNRISMAVVRRVDRNASKT
jgi:hypothetical protein